MLDICFSQTVNKIRIREATRSYKAYILCLSSLRTHLCPFSKSKFNLKSDRVNLVAPASPIECLIYLPNVQCTNLDRKGWPGSEIILKWMIVFSETRAFKSRHGRSNKGKLNFFKQNNDQHYRPIFTQIKQNNDQLCQSFLKIFAHFHLKSR